MGKMGKKKGIGQIPAKSKSASSSNPDREVSAKANRSGGSTRDKATIKRLNMYRGSTVKRNVKGKVVGGDLLERGRAGGQELTGQSGRIAPDRRWFGNTRTIGQAELDKFREDMRTVAADPFQVVLHRKKVPVGLVRDDALVDEAETKRAVKAERAKARRRELLEHEPFRETFGGGSGGTSSRKRPKLASGDLAGLVARAKARADEYETANSGEDARTEAYELDKAVDGVKEEVSHDLFAKGQSRRIWAELYKVLDCSDVVLHVVDARDPPGTTCDRVVKHVKSKAGGKSLVFVLNKCDLVPTWVVKKWIYHLAKTAPAVAFRASNTKAFGKAAVLDLLKQFAKLKSDAKQISVGVVGYPNVGKSSLINALRSKAVCKVAPVPGETKVWQYVALTKRINLIDSPGVVYDRDAQSDADAVFKGIVRAERLPDPDVFVADLLLRCHDLDHLTATYGPVLPLDKALHSQARQRAQLGDSTAAHPLADAADAFVQNLARKMGRLLPGGEPDVRTVAVMLINDWQRGKIPHFRPPPQSAETHGGQSTDEKLGHRPDDDDAPVDDDDDDDDDDESQ